MPLGQAVLDGHKYKVPVTEAWKINMNIQQEVKVLIYKKYLPEADRPPPSVILSTCPPTIATEKMAGEHVGTLSLEGPVV